MKHDALTKPAGTVEVWEECEACNGTGRQLESFRYAGEAYGGYVETCCDDCDGDGGWFAEPMCPGCDGELDGGYCAACESFVPIVSDTSPDKGWPRVSL